MTILIFVIILGLLVFVHEFGHFIVARRHGVKAEEFGFGFPPRIFGVWKSEAGKFHFIRGNKEIKDLPSTLYSINWLPLGGFVKIKGEGGEDKNDPDSFASQVAWRRGTILLAGVFMNALLTVILLSIGFGTGIPQDVGGIESYARVRDQKIEVIEVLKDSPAAAAGLLPGDVIVRINDIVPKKADEFRDYVRVHVGAEMHLTVRHNGAEKSITVRPEKLSGTDRVGIGVFLLDTGIVSYLPHIALWKGVVATGLFSFEILRSFGELLKTLLLSGKVNADLSGPVGIAVLTGKVARLGFPYLLQFTALLSINLAMLNVLPIPALDGGRFLFLIIERVRRKPISKKTENLIHNLGFFLLILLVILVTFRDIQKFQDVILRFLRLR